MSSSDNPQFEPQPLVSAETPMLSAPDPFAAASVTPVPTTPPLIENPVWDGWDVLLIAGLTLVTMVVFQLAVLLAAHWLWYPHESLADVSKKPILLIASQFLIYIPVAACMIALVEGKYHVAFWQAIRWSWPRSEWKLLALGAALFFVLALLQSLLPMPKDTPFEHLFDRPRDAYLLSIIAVTLGPLMEELFFRGFMYPVLARRMGVGSGAGHLSGGRGVRRGARRHAFGGSQLPGACRLQRHANADCGGNDSRLPAHAESPSSALFALKSFAV